MISTANHKKPRPTEDAIKTVVSRFDDTTGFLGLSQKSAVGKSDPVVKETSSSAFPKETDDSKSKEPMSPKTVFPKETSKAKGSKDGTLKLKTSASKK